MVDFIDHCVLGYPACSTTDAQEVMVGELALVGISGGVHGTKLEVRQSGTKFKGHFKF